MHFQKILSRPKKNFSAKPKKIIRVPPYVFFRSSAENRVGWMDDLSKSRMDESHQIEIGHTCTQKSNCAQRLFRLWIVISKKNFWDSSIQSRVIRNWSISIDKNTIKFWKLLSSLQRKLFEHGFLLPACRARRAVRFSYVGLGIEICKYWKLGFFLRFLKKNRYSSLKNG